MKYDLSLGGEILAISFQKLLDLLAAREISIYRLKTDKVIGTATIDKLRTNTGNIDTRSINSICEYLQVQPGDLMEWIADKN